MNPRPVCDSEGGACGVDLPLCCCGCRGSSGPRWLGEVGGPRAAEAVGVGELA